MQIIKSTSRLFESYAFILHIKNRTYKIFTPLGYESQEAELQANKSALSAKFWQNRVVEVSPFLSCLAMPKGQPIEKLNREQAQQFMEEALLKSLKYPKRSVCNSFDLEVLRGLERYGMKAHLLTKAAQALKDTCLPITSAHGDLHINNMIMLDGELRIIDWAMYNSKGSFITDYIHFYNYQKAISNKQSWTVAILAERLYLEKLAQLLSVGPTQLRIAYALSRIYGEVYQQRKLSLIPPKQIVKYNNVLEQLTTNAN